MIIRIPKEAAIEIHYSVKVIVFLQILVGSGALKPLVFVEVWELNSAQVFVEVVRCNPVDER